MAARPVPHQRVAFPDHGNGPIWQVVNNGLSLGDTRDELMIRTVAVYKKQEKRVDLRR
jgi:hypothetical protein